MLTPSTPERGLRQSRSRRRYRRMFAIGGNSENICLLRALPPDPERSSPGRKMVPLLGDPTSAKCGRLALQRGATFPYTWNFDKSDEGLAASRNTPPDILIRRAHSADPDGRPIEVPG